MNSTPAATIAPRAFRNLVLTILFTGLAFLFVILRLISRFVLTKSGGKDEWAIIVSLVCAIGLLPATIHQANHGLGIHTDDLNITDIKEILKALYVAILLYIMSLWLTKLAIALQYLRAFQTGKTRIAVWFALAITVAYGIEATFLAVFSCRPVAAFWNPSIPGKCIDRKVGYFTNATYQIFSDLVFLIIPMPILSKLQIPLKQKVLVMSAFGIGTFGCILSILRLHSLYVLGVSDDIAFDNANTSMWSNLEVDVAILCACSQTFHPLIKRFFPRLYQSNKPRQTTTQPFPRIPLPIYKPTQIPGMAGNGPRTMIYFTTSEPVSVEMGRKVSGGEFF